MEVLYNDFSWPLLVIQILVFVVPIAILYYVVKLYRAVMRYVTRFDDK